MHSLLAYSERFGSMVSRVFLTLLYYLVLGPFALLYKVFADPLHIRRRPAGNWTGWEARNESVAQARRQD